LVASVHKKYLIIFLLIFVSFFSPIFLSNLRLNYKSFIASCDQEKAAADWQYQTKNVACLSSQGSGKFKKFRIMNALMHGEVNTIIFGSSTAQGIKSSMFPIDQKVYNFALDSNPLYAIISQVDYFIRYDKILYFVVPIDWALDLSVIEGEKIPRISFKEVDLKEEKVLWPSLIKDSLTTSKTKILFGIIKNGIYSGTPLENLRGILYSSNEEYKCPDGSIAKDFTTPYPRKCAGFNYDGSTDFFLRSSLSEADIIPLSEKAASKDSIYLKSLKKLNENIDRYGLNVLSNIVIKIKNKGGSILFILPPLLPNLEKKILETSERAELLKLKNKLNEFAIQNNVHILDMGQSEEYGCKALDFIDEHHALPSCFHKILSRFFSQRDKLGYGLIGPVFQSVP